MKQKAADLKNYYDRDILFPHGSFIAFIHYLSQEKALRVTFRTGKVYKYLNIPNGRFHSILMAQNRGSYMVQHILGRTDFEKLECLPPATLQRILNSQSLYKFLAR